MSDDHPEDNDLIEQIIQRWGSNSQPGEAKHQGAADTTNQDSRGDVASISQARKDILFLIDRQFRFQAEVDFLLSKLHAYQQNRSLVAGGLKYRGETLHDAIIKRYRAAVFQADVHSGIDFRNVVI